MEIEDTLDQVDMLHLDILIPEVRLMLNPDDQEQGDNLGIMQVNNEVVIIQEDNRSRPFKRWLFLLRGNRRAESSGWGSRLIRDWVG